MKFTKALKKLLKKPDITISSVSQSSYEQDLTSLKHWFCIDDEGGPDSRVKTFERFLKATDWKVDVKRKST
jgi:hypothetical protein